MGGHFGRHMVTQPGQTPLAIDLYFLDLLCVGAVTPSAGSKVRTRRSGAQGQEKYETKRFHDRLLSLGDFFAGTEGRQVEML